MDVEGVSKEMIQAALKGLGVGDAGSSTVANLPDPSLYDRMTWYCTDLHDGIGGRPVSESGFWKPIRPLALFQQANSNQDMTLIPLLHSPTQVLPTILTLARTLTLATTYNGKQVAYPGQRFRIKRTGGGLFSLLINGVGLSLNSWSDFEYDPVASTFVQTAGGGLL